VQLPERIAPILECLLSVFCSENFTSHSVEPEDKEEVSDVFEEGDWDDRCTDCVSVTWMLGNPQGIVIDE
jgi:hypothetical protein